MNNGPYLSPVDYGQDVNAYLHSYDNSNNRCDDHDGDANSIGLYREM